MRGFLDRFAGGNYPRAMTLRRLFLVAAILTTALRVGIAEEASPWVFVPNARLYGADITLGYTGVQMWPGLPTTFWGHLGGGYVKQNLHRSFLTSPVAGSPSDPRLTPDASPYWNLTFDTEIGAGQGIFLPGLEVVLLNKYRWDHHYATKDVAPALFASALPDREGLFVSSFLAALRFDLLEMHSLRRTASGPYLEVSAEWAPAGLFGSPAAFFRLNAHAVVFITLLDRNHLALVVGDRLEADVLIAADLATIPVFARTSFGGLNPYGFGIESGLGGEVRGIASRRFDGTLKVVNNLEARLLFPEILPGFFSSVFPGVIAFVDAGTSDYRALNKHPAIPGDIFVSTGVGAYVRAMVADLVLYGTYSFHPEARGFDVSFAFSTNF